MSNNPYQKEDGTWWFHDETGADEYGPFSTKARANMELANYCYFLDYGPTLWQRIWWPTRRAITSFFDICSAIVRNK